ncbi:MAG TPA: hypothetical protein VGQ76_02640 [Thermoanaerobaculia bacterium]|jgi:hypothetical protein|nr:hypothetical protein [Thermoanaerobaculia bacterium]
MKRLARMVAAIALLFCGADALRAGEDYVAMVPWRVLEPETNVDAGLALYWIPASGEELRRSELLTSDDLTLFSSQCVAMRVVRLNDEVRLTRFAEEEELPLAVLVDHAGEVIGRVESEHGVLSVEKVEDLVRDELDRLAAEKEVVLDRARERAEAHDVEAAAALYQSVWEARCECPRQGRVARKALRRLGRR